MNNEILDIISNDNKNFIVDGDIATGKTTNVLFPVVEELINKKESLFILDSKEEYINRYYDKLEKNNYNTIIINIRDFKSEGWNPLEYPYNLYKIGCKDQALEYLEKMGKTMFYEENEPIDSFWVNSATDFFTGVTLALFEDGKKEEINFNSIYSMFNAIDKEVMGSNYLNTYFDLKDKTDTSYIYASPTLLSPKDTRGGILATAKQRLKLYVARENLSHLLNKTTFSFDNVVDKPTAIIFIAKDEDTTLNVFASMFIEQLYMILIEKHNKIKFNLILDNIDIIDKCNELSNILSSCISRNVKVYLSTRSLEELTKKYGDYILKLCNLISIKNDSIIFNDNNIGKTVNVNFNVSNIKYPVLNNNDIKIFDVEKVVKENPNFNKLKLKETNRIDELIKRIDEKLIEIDKKSNEIK